MKLIRLAGGMGNQMFIYAFGLGLSKKYKRIYFNKKNYKKQKNRNYELGIFPNLQIKFRPRYRFIPCHKNKESTLFKFNKDLLNAHFNEYWTGYFQNEKYFANVESDVRHAFEFPEFDKDDTFNKTWAKTINECKNPVFIHVRRGDYVELDGWLLGIDYYKNAVKYIKSHVKNPTFFVFSDADESYIRDNFKIGCKYLYIGTHNADTSNSFRDMHLMSLCKHAIIANSSFSWWGAWLQKNKQNVVCAPSPWLFSCDDIICENWVKIPRK